jgi:hypothetical protein
VERIKKEKVGSFMKSKNITGLGMLMSAAIGMLGVSSAHADVTFVTTPGGTINDGGTKYTDTASATFSETTVGSQKELVITLINTSLALSGGGTFQEDVGNTMYSLYFSVNGHNLTSFFSLASGVGAAGDTEYTVPSMGVVNTSTVGAGGAALDWILQSSGLSGLVQGDKEGLVAGNFTLPPGNSLSNNNGHSPYFSDAMIFTLDYSGTLNLSDIANVQFEYGTGGNVTVDGVPGTAPVPEASTVVAGALMLLPLGVGAIRALRKEKGFAPAKIS